MKPAIAKVLNPKKYHLLQSIIVGTLLLEKIQVRRNNLKAMSEN